VAKCYDGNIICYHHNATGTHYRRRPRNDEETASSAYRVCNFGTPVPSVGVVFAWRSRTEHRTSYTDGRVYTNYTRRNVLRNVILTFRIVAEDVTTVFIRNRHSCCSYKLVDDLEETITKCRATANCLMFGCAELCAFKSIIRVA